MATRYADSMTAREIADRLALRGVKIRRVIEPSLDSPGRIDIRKNLYVEVSRDGTPPFIVVPHSPEGVLHGFRRKRIGDLEDDISCTIHQAPAAWPPKPRQ